LWTGSRQSCYKYRWAVLAWLSPGRICCSASTGRPRPPDRQAQQHQLAVSVPVLRVWPGGLHAFHQNPVGLHEGPCSQCHFSNRAITLLALVSRALFLTAGLPWWATAPITGALVDDSNRLGTVHHVVPTRGMWYNTLGERSSSISAEEEQPFLPSALESLPYGGAICAYSTRSTGPDQPHRWGSGR
jgi:hypothetical protein